MSVQSTARYAGPFAGNAVTTVFAFAFKVFATTDVVVLQTVTATGAVSNPINGTDYTVALNADQTANPGGTITFAVAPPVTVTFYITSSIPKSQPSTYPNPGPWNPTTAENSWDRAIAVIQEVDQAALKYAPGDVASTHVLPPPIVRANTMLGFDAAGVLKTFALATATTLTNLAASGGAALIGFIAAGANAVARTLQAKERDIYSAKDAGAVGDGVTDDKTKISNAMTDSTVVLLPNNGTYVCASRLNIPSSLFGPATLKSTAVASGGDFGITGNNVTIRDVTFIGSSEVGGQVLFINAPSVASLHLDHIGIQNTIGNGSDGQSGLQISNSGVNKISLTNSDISANLYGVLVNTGSTNGVDIQIRGNRIYSDRADAIELNVSGITLNDVIISDNWLKASTAGAGAGGGFAIGVAAPKNVVITGNIIAGSRNEAIHVEDAQNGITVTGNTLHGCASHGIKLLNNAAATAQGIVVSGNQITSASGAASTVGINLVNDGNGSLPGCAICGNRIRGFPTGMDFGSVTEATVDGNLVENATTAYLAGANFLGTGVNYADGCTNLVSLVQGVFGKVISKTTPTAILVKGSVTNSPAMIRGFAFPSASFNHGGTGLEWFTLFPVGDRMQGKIEVYVNFANADTASIMEDFDWTGAALTQGKVYTVLNGIIAAIDLRVNGGNVQLGLNMAAVRNGLIARLNFDGQYWKL